MASLWDLDSFGMVDVALALVTCCLKLSGWWSSYQDLLVKNPNAQRHDGLFDLQVVTGLGHLVNGHAEWAQWATVDLATVA